jgi:hypothetical protein
MSSRPRWNVFSNCEERWMRAIKVVVTSPYAASVDAFIGTLSEVAVSGVPRRAVGPGGEAGRGLRFGRLALSRDTVLQLFGIDWQDLARFPWETVASGLIGAIVLVDAGATDPAGVVAPVLRLLAEQGDLPVVLAAEHLRAGDGTGVAPLEVAAGPAGVAVTSLLSGDRRSALDAVITLIRTSIGEVEAGSDGGVDPPFAAPPGAGL